MDQEVSLESLKSMNWEPITVNLEAPICEDKAKIINQIIIEAVQTQSTDETHPE